MCNPTDAAAHHAVRNCVHPKLPQYWCHDNCGPFCHHSSYILNIFPGWCMKTASVSVMRFTYWLASFNRFHITDGSTDTSSWAEFLLQCRKSRQVNGQIPALLGKTCCCLTISWTGVSPFIVEEIWDVTQ